MNNLIEDLIPVILSGGSGSRLWPLSRASYPKQYLNLDENNNFSLLQNTFLRLKGLNKLREPIIISNEEQRFIVAEQMREINVKPNSIILEPFGKNTAPAIALAALTALRNKKDPILLTLSSDHKIDDDENFKNAIEKGLLSVKNGRIVTFGIVPSRPETGYGYIESFEEISNTNKVSNIKKFIEKPNLELAKKLIRKKNYFWNSGIFLCKSSIFLNQLEKFEPEILSTCKKALKAGYEDLDFFRINPDIFTNCPNKSIDVAVMEKTDLGSIVTLNAGWDDIGSWSSVWNNAFKNAEGNALKGKVIIEECKNCYFRSEERLVVGIDLNELIIIETNDAILVANKNATQKVKKIVDKLNKNNFLEGKDNKKSYRPWGSFTSIEKGISWQVKKLELKPNASLSLQLHHFRSEHWVVVKGTAKVEIDGEISILKENESTYIPLGAKHRLSNPDKTPLVLIEVQSGTYLGEDDIVRFDDIYGRLTK